MHAETKTPAPEGLTDETLLRQFACPPANSTAEREAIHAAGLTLAQTILASTAPIADQTAAVRKILEAVWTADAALKPAPPPTSIASTPIEKAGA